MKKIFFALLLLTQTAQAQYRQIGGTLTVKSGTQITALGDIQMSGGACRNLGTVQCASLTAAPAATLRGNGYYRTRRTLSLLGSLLDHPNFVCTGDSTSSVTTVGSVWGLFVEKDNGGTVALATPLTLVKQLKFNHADNRLVLGNNDLTLQPNCLASGANATRFVVTNGTGRMVKQALGGVAFTFPVGADAASYRPLRITNSGATDDIGVTMLPALLDGGGTGNPIAAEAVNGSWLVTEATPGGSNLVLKTQWNAADELAGFDRSHCAVRRFDGSAWAATQPLGKAVGTNPYTRTTSGLTAVGYFGVFDGTLPRPADRSELLGTLEIAPNPVAAGGSVLLTLPEMGDWQVEVWSLDGQLLFSNKLGSVASAWLDLRGLPPGLVLVRTRAAGGREATGTVVVAQ